MDLQSLARQPDNELARIDIARFSFDSAADLPWSVNLDVEDALERLDAWTALVEKSTTRWESSYRRTPERHNGSLAQFQVCAMLTVVQRDLGVRYNMAFIEGPADGRDSRNLFLHGPLLGHGGTCASLPLLYLAIGRRLGYPLHLVETKEHLFLRWEDADELFNIECTSRGFAPRTDEYYCTWPYRLSENERTNGRFLTSKSPRQVLATVLSHRCWCLMDNLRFASAVITAHAAAQLDEHQYPLWFLATMVHRIELVLQESEKTVRVPPDVLLAAARPRVKKRWQLDIHKDVAANYRRILGLHRADWLREFGGESDLFFEALGSDPEQSAASAKKETSYV